MIARNISTLTIYYSERGWITGKRVINQMSIKTERWVVSANWTNKAIHNETGQLVGWKEMLCKNVRCSFSIGARRTCIAVGRMAESCVFIFRRRLLLRWARHSLYRGVETLSSHRLWPEITPRILTLLESTLFYYCTPDVSSAYSYVFRFLTVMLE